MSISNIARRLGRLDLGAVRQAALAAAAETIASDLRTSLTGALADSIGVTADGDTALVGSTSDVALNHARGTAKRQPRPVFAAIGPDHAEAAAASIGAAVAAAIRSA
jgi:hypothetical protein